MKEIMFRTRRGAQAWAKSFNKETGAILMIHRDRNADIFSRTKGCWVLEIPEHWRDEFTAVFGVQPYVINQ